MKDQTMKTKRLTIATVRETLRTLNIQIGRTSVPGEFWLNRDGGTEATKYFTDDLQDALDTGVQMGTTWANNSAPVVPADQTKEKHLRQLERGLFMDCHGWSAPSALPCDSQPVFEVSLPLQEGYGHGRVLARWSGATKGFTTPPAIGSVVRLTINNIGLGTVRGYWVEAGFLGVKVSPHNPPQWWKDQNPSRPACTVFGSEIAALRWVVVHVDSGAVQADLKGKTLFFASADEASAFYAGAHSHLYKVTLESEVTL